MRLRKAILKQEYRQYGVVLRYYIRSWLKRNNVNCQPTKAPVYVIRKDRKVLTKSIIHRKDFFVKTIERNIYG